MTWIYRLKQTHMNTMRIRLLFSEVIYRSTPQYQPILHVPGTVSHRIAKMQTNSSSLLSKIYNTRIVRLATNMLNRLLESNRL